MKNIVVVMLFLCTVAGYAQQTIEQKLVEVLNDRTNGGMYKVAVQAKGTNLDWNNTLKGLTIDVNYENTKFSFPTSGAQINAATSWNAMFATSGVPYTRSTTNPSTSYVRVILTNSSVGGNFDGTPAGFDFTNSYQTLVTLTFTILNNSTSANFSIAGASNSVSLFDVHNDSLQTGTGIGKTLSAPVNIVDVPLDVEVEPGFRPRELMLAQNYPNPFNPSTNIEFTVPKDGHALVTIYNLLGQLMATVFDGEARASYVQKTTFDASWLSSGVYFMRLQYSDKTLIKRIMLMK